MLVVNCCASERDKNRMYCRSVLHYTIVTDKKKRPDSRVTLMNKSINPRNSLTTTCNLIRSKRYCFPMFVYIMYLRLKTSFLTHKVRPTESYHAAKLENAGSSVTYRTSVAVAASFERQDHLGRC